MVGKNKTSVVVPIIFNNSTGFGDILKVEIILFVPEFQALTNHKAVR
jgi:hypothetical protein